MATVTATIKSKGKTMKPTYRLLSIDTTKEFNKLPVAEVKVAGGNVAQQEFKTLDDDFFLPGAKIEIFLRGEGAFDTEHMVFAGIVVNHVIEWAVSGPILTIELSDQAIKMTSLRKNAVYKNQKDKNIIESLVSKQNLKAGEIAKTEAKHAQMVQYYATDWDFMLSRAEANGQLVITNDGELSTVKPEIKIPSLALEFGRDFSYFNAQLNSRNQYHDVSSVGWDVAKQKLTRPEKAKDYKVEHDYDISDISTLMGAKEARLVHAAPMDPSELRSWSDAQLMKSRLSLLRGTIKIKGNGKIKVGQTVDIRKLSRFTGKHVISGVRQAYTVKGGWFTYIQIGMDTDWFTAQTNIIDTQAAGLLPGVNGLQIGVVQAHKEDTDNQFLVLVSIPAFDSLQSAQGQEGNVWARLASVDAGSDRGMFFLPEKGDEVVVGFLNDDPRQAIILGSMYSKANKTPVPVKEKKNGQKGIFTKSKYQLLFDEENEIITLATSDKNKICIDEKQGLINLMDTHGNQVELSKKGLMIISAGDCQINAGGNFTVEAKGNVKIKGKKVDLI